MLLPEAEAEGADCRSKAESHPNGSAWFVAALMLLILGRLDRWRLHLTRLHVAPSASHLSCLPEAQTVQLFVGQIEPMERVIPDATDDLIGLEDEGESATPVFDRILCFAHSPLGAVAPDGPRSSFAMCRERRLAC